MIKVTLISNNPRQSFMANETNTVKQILDDRDVTYGNAAVSVDGATLNAGEINKSLAELGVEEKVVISVLAHMDNAANVSLAGAAAIITSGLKLDQIKRFKKYRPEALTLYDEDDEPIYAIDFDEGPGSINKNGAVFGAATNADGYATITVVLDPAEEDKKQLVIDKLGAALLKLNELENGLAGLDEELAAEETEILSHITIA